MKKIDSDKLKKEIDNIYSEALCDFKSNKTRYSEGAMDAAKRILNVVKMLESEQAEQ